MQNKPLLFGLLAGAVGLWILLSWDPVAREEPEDDDVTEAEPAAPTQAAAPAAPAPPQPQPTQAEAPKHDPAPEPEQPAEEAPVEPSNGIKLVQASKEELDKADLPPPSASGPLQALQKEFESGARDASSSELESKIGEAFKLQHVSPDLLESAVCHGNTCRVRARWTPERAGGFTVAVTTLAVNMAGKEGHQPMFDRNFAVGPASERNSNGERSIDVYLRKNTATAENK